LLNGNADLSGDLALRIEKAFGVKMDTLVRMQASYDIVQTRKRERQIHVRRIHQTVSPSGEAPAQYAVRGKQSQSSRIGRKD
jgi:plasmid maintenance system antidote protein VapI